MASICHFLAVFKVETCQIYAWLSVIEHRVVPIEDVIPLSSFLMLLLTLLNNLRSKITPWNRLVL